MKTHNLVIIVLGSAAGGALIGVFCCNWEYFQFEKTIKISDLAALLVNVGLALYVASSIQNRVSNDRAIKDYLVAELKETKIKVDEIHSKIEAGTSMAVMVSTLKIFNGHLTNLESMIKKSSYSKKVSLAVLRSNFRGLRFALTHENIPDMSALTIPNRQKAVDHINNVKVEIFTAILSMHGGV